MAAQNYKTMTDDELKKFMVDDPDAYYELYLRHRNTKFADIPGNCRNRSDDFDYYGSTSAGNR